MFYKNYFFYQKTNTEIDHEKLFHDRNIICCSSGFNFKAFIFGIFWLIYHRMWLTLIAAGIILGVFCLAACGLHICNNQLMNVLCTLMSLFLAISSIELMHFELKRKKYQLISVVNECNMHKAKLKFIKSLSQDQ